jgi:regulatory factor X
MSFGYDMDMNTSQQEPNHDDSGIGLLEDGIDASFATKMQQSLKSHLSQAPLSILPQSIR